VSVRLKRAARLTALAEKALTSARARAAEAQRAARAAASDAERQESAWAEASQQFAKTVEFAGDLATEAAHLRTLRLRADAGAKRASEAMTAERHSTELVIEAERDRRKLELWQERLTATEREQETLVERKASDELAARTARGRT
jgi:hypothetical protein